MAKRDSETTRANGGTTPADTMEQRVAAFAEQLGRNRRDVAREGRRRWLDREAPTKQIASVRDSAAELLEQLADSAMKASKSNPVATAALDTTKGRSGGVVDAPGKKHRKPMRTDPGANITDSQAAQDADGKDDGQDAPAPWARVADATSGALFESGSFLNPEVLLHSRHNLGIREFVSGLNIDRALGERLGAGETLLEFQLASRSISLRVVGAPITKALAVNAAHSRT